jgi:phospholipid/cholesterol/gamma-HCH transport system substrate-binding protein
MNARMRSLATAITAVLGLAVVGGCGPTMRDLPLPGSGVSGNTITITIPFDEALNLAQGAAIKVNGVDSGKVQSVAARDFKAIATIKVLTEAQMRRNATARLRYTTPLGELFVDVSNPATGPLMRNGDELAASNATTAPTVEDALSSASLLVNGGGLNQLQTVTDELNKAIGGREGTVRELLDRSNTFLNQASATTGDIDAALRSLAGLSQVLNQNKSTINAAMTQIRPAAAVLRENTPGLTRLLAQLVTFSATANNVVGHTRAQIESMVNQVTPVLREFLGLRADLGPSFSDLVNVSKLLNTAVPGDYANMRLVLELDQVGAPNPLGPGGGGSTGGNGTGGLLGGLGGTGGTGGLLGGLGGLLGGLLGGGSTSPRVISPATSSSPMSLSGMLAAMSGGIR